MRVRTATRVAASATVVVVLGLAAAAPASAEESPSPKHGQSQSSLRSALERDLNLNADEASRLLKAQAGIADLNDRLTADLGSDFAGSWFDQKAGKLVVAVSSSDRVAAVTAAGAKAKVFGQNLRSLTAIKSELDLIASRTGEDSRSEAVDARVTLAGAVSWAVDQEKNQVLVTLRQGQGAALRAFLARYGDAVRIEETKMAPRAAGVWFNGGDPYNSCSVGFNVTRDGQELFLSAGHCGNTGDMASSRGKNIGPFVGSRFPGADDSLIRNDHPNDFTPGPWVNIYSPDDPDAYIDIHGSADSPVGTAVCKSGRTTRLTCGVIRFKDVSVNYYDDVAQVDRWVNHLTQHTACVEPGDSGGSNYSSTNNSNFAEGMTSGGGFADETRRCNEKIPGAGENVSYFFPIERSLAHYNATLSVF